VKDETKHFIYASLCALFACLTATVPALVVSAKLDPHIEGLALFVRDRVDLSQTSLVQALFHNARERVESLAGVSSGLSAQVSLPTLSISRSGGGAGSIFGPGIFCGSDCTERYVSGTAVLLSAVPQTGSFFSGWQGACTGIGTCSVSMTTNRFVTATFGLSPATTAPRTASTTIEAESGTLFDLMATEIDSSARNYRYITSYTANYGTAVFSPYLEKGTYYVWARVLSPDSSKDSFYVSFNGANEDTFDTAEGTWSTKWQWSRVNGRGSRNIPLAINPRPFVVASPGTQRFTFRAKEAQTKLDAIFITTDQTALPEIGATLTSVSIDENATNTISSITVSNITDRSATVKWTTKKPSSSQVEYGTTAKYGSITDFDYNRVLAHEVILNNLRPETTYWYKVISTDNLNKSISSAGKTSFKTKATSTVQAAPPTPPPSPSPGAIRVPRGTIFATTLKPGTEHPDVRYMQMLLNDLGFTITLSGPGSKGQETMYFGEATKRALILFQERYAAEVLAPAGLTSGTGTFGPLTRGKFNALVAQ